MKINTKLLLAFLLIVLIPLIAIGIVFHINARESMTQEVLNHLQSVAEIQRNRVESIVEQNLERLSLVSSRTQLRISLDSFITNPNTADLDKINQILLDARSSVSSFRDISILTLDGTIVASTDADITGSSHFNDEAFIRGQDENTADIFFLDENQDLYVYLSGPLYLEGELLGVVIVESTADSILSAIADYTGLGTTGETVLAKRDINGDALFITPTRFDNDAALSRAESKDNVDSPIVQALSKNEKLFTDTVDYRGEPVLAATEYISETDWGLVTKIDKAEALAPVFHLQHILITVVAILAALVVIISFLLARTITRPIIKLVQMAVKVSEGDLTVRAEVETSDEIGVLAQACNQMKDSLVQTNSELERELAERKAAEDVLRESEARYRTTLGNMLEGCQIIDFNYRYLYLNDTAIEHSRRTSEELLGHTMMEMYPGIENTEMFSYLRLCMEERTPHRMENQFTYPDGSQGWFELSIEPVSEGVFVLSIDITERKQMEQALRKSEERYRDLFDNTNDLIQSVDPDGRFLYVNKAWQQVLKYSEEEVRNLNMWDIIHPDSKAHCTEVFQKVMSGEAASNIEAIFVTKDGESVFVEGNAHCMFEDGKPVSTQGIFRDVTERKLAEERVSHLTTTLRALRNVNQLITREKDKERLIQESCKILVRDRSYGLAWIALLDENKEIISTASAGIPARSFSSLINQMKRGELPFCLRSLTQQEQSFLVVENVELENGECPLTKTHKEGAAFASRLEYEGKLYGTLAVDVPSKLALDEEEQGLFLELCGDVSFALYSIEQEEKRKQAEEEIRLQEDKYRGLAESISDIFFAFDKKLRYIYWNRASEELTGIPAEDAMGKHLYDIFPKDEQTEKAEKVYIQALQTGQPQYFDNEYRLGEKNYFFEISAYPSTEGLAVFVKDVTERRRIEKALYESEQNFRNSLDDSPLGVVINQSMGEAIYVNQAALDLFGYNDIEEMRNTPMAERHMPENIARFKERWKRIEKSEFTSEKDSYYIIRKNGEMRYVEAYFKKIVWGGQDCIQVVFHDITERKEAEETFRVLAEESSGGIYIVQGGKFVYTNLQFQKTTGYSAEELLNMDPLSLVIPEDRDEVRRNAIRMLRGELSTPYEFRISDKNGDIRWSLESVSSIQYRGKQASLGSFQDITERKKMDEQLIVTDRLSSVGELAAGIAHELNNPLTGVIGFSELLVEKKDVPEDIREDLTIINREAVRASQVARHLLTFARKHPDEKQPTNINAIIQVVLELREYEQRVNNIEVDARLQADLPSVQANDFQLQQVFLNIIINAEHFMIEEHGQGTLTIITEQQGDIIRVSFADDGPGIDPEHLGRIFDPFYTTKEIGKGTGLGLSICYGIITEHGGKIYVESDLGKGATFTIELPVLRGE